MLASCQQKSAHKPSVIFSERPDTLDGIGLEDVQESGTIVAGTLFGPDTYYEWHGRGWGLQYLMADAFATSIGARLEMLVARDREQLMSWLDDGEIDFVAIRPDGAKPDVSPYWLCASPSIKQALSAWWSPDVERVVIDRYNRKVKSGSCIHRRPMWRNRAKGIISDYDDIFMRHATAIGWDWRLLAAQCFQESGFDPNARSWAGAQGLMQIIPQTAASLGISASEIYRPESNIAGAARYIVRLNSIFADIVDKNERINFVLAAYNAGPGHIQDAQALTRKNGGNPQKWNEVSRWVLNLQQPTFYRDAVVRHGYMRGTETVDYVRQIHSHWNHYRAA